MACWRGRCVLKGEQVESILVEDHCVLSWLSLLKWILESVLCDWNADFIGDINTTYWVVYVLECKSRWWHGYLGLSHVCWSAVLAGDIDIWDRAMCAGVQFSLMSQRLGVRVNAGVQIWLVFRSLVNFCAEENKNWKYKYCTMDWHTS